MEKWPGAPFFGSLRPAGAQNKTLISNTEYMGKGGMYCGGPCYMQL